MRGRLGDICNIFKGTTGITKAVPGSYPMVTLSEQRKTHNSYQFDAKAVIIPLISSTGHGHASMKRIHYQEGKFALGTILCAVIPKNEKILNAKYLHIFLTQYKDSLLVSLMRGAANVSLPINKIGDLEIEIPPLVVQKKIIELEKKSSKLIDDVSLLLNNQQVNLKKLKEQILNDAINGKLVPQDSNDEPATILLEKIKAEKEKLIKEKKLKKSKPLPPIQEEEKLFELPKSWEWVRLNEIFNFIDYRGKTPTKNNFGVRLITAKNIRPGFINKNPEEFITEEIYEKWMTRGYPKHGDLLFTTEAPLGNVAKVDINEKFALAQRVIDLQPYKNINTSYLLFALLSNTMQRQFRDNASGMTAKGIKATRLKLIPIMFPPYEEQKRIVKKVEELLKFCEELEKQVKQNQNLTQQLLQSALKEALEPKVN